MIVLNRFFTLIFITLLSTFGFGQDYGKYDSIYTPIKGVSGEAQFDYYTDIDHLIVKNGAFKFVSDNSDTTWRTVNEDQSWEGHYTENKKQGEWTYKTSKHELDIISIEDDHLEYDLRTIRTELKANYKQGIPDGLWVSNSEIINKNEAPSFFEKVEITFKKGKAEGPYSYQFLEANKSVGEISGTFKNGLFDDIWQFKYFKDANQIREKRYYTNGILTALIRSKNMGQQDSIAFRLSPQTQAVLNSNEKSHFINRPFSIEFNDGYPRTSVYMQSQLEGNAKLRKTHNQLLRFDKTWLNKQKFAFGANRGRYLLTKDEEIYITQWFRIEQDFQFLVEKIKEHEIRDFGESKDSIALFTIAWVEQQENLFNDLGLLSQIFLSKEIEFYYRDDLLKQRTIDVLRKDSIVFGKDYNIIEYEISEENQKNVFTYLLENYKQRILIGKAINEALNASHTSSSIEDELERLPKRIAAERARLDSTFTPNTKDKAVNALLTHINDDFLEGSIKRNYEEFQNTEDLEQKKMLRDTILVELNSVSQLYTAAYAGAERSVYVDSLYTEYVFDAFTFSDNVPSRVKKRLFDQVQKIQNELIEKATKSETPSECLEYVQKIAEVQVVLIYLRDKQTKSLEKSLNRANSLDEKLKLLNEVL